MIATKAKEFKKEKQNLCKEIFNYIPTTNEALSILYYLALTHKVLNEQSTHTTK